MRQPLIGLVHGPAYHAHDRSRAFMRADALTSGRKASRSVHPSGASRRIDFRSLALRWVPGVSRRVHQRLRFMGGSEVGPPYADT